MTSPAAEARDSVGPYRVIRAIGAGGSARIDLARIDRAYGFQRHVVLKRPLEHLRGDPAVAASLRREARIGGQLRHPNLVAVLDAGSHDNYDFLVLEYVHGAALRTLMQSDAPGSVHALPLNVALAITSEVARGMHEAHELCDDHGAPLGLVHRDVSPGNILIGLDGAVKLADFGIAKETRVSTLSGSLHGTVTYMAPEQCQGHAFDRRADVFSLGVILYELVTETRLFWADNDVASLHRVLSGTVPRPRELKPELPAALEDLLLTAVAHDPAQRYPTALALADAIEGYAAAAGEVLGARWIARSVEQRVGARQVPWIAATTVPDATPRGDGSLVDLIASLALDEPVSETFGDGGNGDDAEGDAESDEDLGKTRELAAIREPKLEHEAMASAAAAAMPAPQASAPSGPRVIVAPSGPRVIVAPPTLVVRPLPAPAAPRRKHPLLAGIIALGVIAGSATTAIVMTRKHAALPSTPETATAAPPSTPAAPPTPASAPAAPAPAAPAAPAPAAIVAQPTIAPDSAAQPAVAAPDPAGPARKKHPPSHHHSRDASDTHAAAADPAPATTPPEAGAGVPSTVKPATNVEWKPTLLLPTDGSGARTAK